MNYSELLTIIAPLFILQIILLVVALIDLFKNDATRGPKIVWVLVIVFLNIIGPIIYFIFGRKEK